MEFLALLHPYRWRIAPDRLFRSKHHLLPIKNRNNGPRSQPFSGALHHDHLQSLAPLGPPILGELRCQVRRLLHPIRQSKWT